MLGALDGPTWAPWVRAWPVLGQPQTWLPSSGEFAGPYCSGQTVTDKVNNRVDPHILQVISNNSVQKWDTALNAGLLLCSILFSVFTNNLVNAIKGVIIKNLLGLPRGKDYILVGKQHLALKRVITALY